MKKKEIKIWVYADWQSLGGVQHMGILTPQRVRGKEIFSFEYNDTWMTSSGQVLFLDPNLSMYKGKQYLPDEQHNFGLFLDSSPDRWGRLLMRRKEAWSAKKEQRDERILFESDFLLGVFDGNRMGGLRFKLEEDGSLGEGQPNIQFHFVPLTIKPDYSTDIYNVNTYPTYSGFSIMSIVLHPKSRGQVKLKSSNPSEPPSIQLNPLSDSNDRAMLVKGLKKAIEVLHSPAFDAYKDGEILLPVSPVSDQIINDHINKSLETLYHPVGTCKMGNDPQAVVNHELKVHGVANLRVIDASIMPSIVSGNTNAAAIMIAEKGADMIIG